MDLYEWTGISGFDMFLHCPMNEVPIIVRCFPNCSVASAAIDNDEGYYYLVNSKEKTISPLPFYALAFGGLYGEDLPVGNELDNVALNLEEYSLVYFDMNKRRGNRE